MQKDKIISLEERVEDLSKENLLLKSQVNFLIEKQDQN